MMKYQDLIVRILFYSDLLGKYAILKSDIKKNADPPSPGAIAFSFNMPFEEALDWFAQRKVVSPEKYYQDLETYTNTGFTISRITQLDTLKEIKNVFTEHMGGDLFDPKKLAEDIQALAVKRGDSPFNPTHLDIVVRQNVLGAYAKGRYVQMKKNSKPYWYYDAILDSRTTPICNELNGKAYPKDSEFWGNFYPPNHFRCRSGVYDYDKDDIKEFDIKVVNPNLNKLKKNFPLKKGFSVAPDKMLTKWINEKVEEYGIPGQKGFIPSKSEKDALKKWSDNEYFNVKKAIKNYLKGDFSDITQNVYAGDLFNMFFKYNQNGDLNKPLYRGLEFQPGDDAFNKYLNYNKGDTGFLDTAMCSCSYSRNIAKQKFAYVDSKCVDSVVIRVKNRSSKGFEIAKYSNRPNEEEVLMPPRTKFKVLKKRVEKKYPPLDIKAVYLYVEEL